MQILPVYKFAIIWNNSWLLRHLKALRKGVRLGNDGEGLETFRSVLTMYIVHTLYNLKIMSRFFSVTFFSLFFFIKHILELRLFLVFFSIFFLAQKCYIYIAHDFFFLKLKIKKVFREFKLFFQTLMNKFKIMIFNSKKKFYHRIFTDFGYVILTILSNEWCWCG